MGGCLCGCCASLLGSCAGNCMGKCLMAGTISRKAFMRTFAIFQLTNVLLTLLWRYLVVLVVPIDPSLGIASRIPIIRDCFAVFDSPAVSDPNSGYSSIWPLLSRGQDPHLIESFRSCLRFEVTIRQSSSFFLILAILMCCSCCDAGAKYAALGWWVAKFGLLCLLPAGFFFVPSIFFVWVPYVAGISAVLFLSAQMVILYDWGRAWNQDWLEKAEAEQASGGFVEENSGRGWRAGILTGSIVFCVISLASTIAQAVLYGATPWISSPHPLTPAPENLGGRPEERNGPALLQPLLWTGWVGGAVLTGVSVLPWAKMGDFLPSSIVLCYLGFLSWVMCAFCPWSNSLYKALYVRADLLYKSTSAKDYEFSYLSPAAMWSEGKVGVPRAEGDMPGDRIALAVVGILLLAGVLVVISQNPALLWMARGEEGEEAAEAEEEALLDSAAEARAGTREGTSEDSKDGVSKKRPQEPAEVNQRFTVAFLGVHLVAGMYLTLLWVPAPGWFLFVAATTALYLNLTLFGYAIIGPQFRTDRDFSETTQS